MMFPTEAFAIPSSPHSDNKTSWDDLFLDFCSYQNDLVCPPQLQKEQVPRTDEELPMSLVRHTPYSPVSPVIKQAPLDEFSQPDYVYTTSNEYRGLSQADRWFFATPKIPSWDFFLEEDYKSAHNTDLPQSPLEETKPARKVQPGCEKVEIKRPSPRQEYPYGFESPPAKRTRKKSQFLVTLHFSKHKLLLGVIGFSGPEKEYRLPIFQQLKSLDEMLRSGTYDNINHTEKYEKTPPSSESTEKRYVSRLTRLQLAIVLGVQNYDVSLVKDIEEIIITLCDQLCGLKIGESSWSKVPRNMRKATVAKVHRFAKVFFPSFTVDNVLTIIKRGAYSRTQDFLRRKRRIERRISSAGKKKSIIES